jgi:TnpA family transposase
VESWNHANSVIFLGKGGDIATNRRDEQELSVLCLRILQGRPGLRKHPDGPGRPRR